MSYLQVLYSFTSVPSKNHKILSSTRRHSGRILREFFIMNKFQHECGNSCSNLSWTHLKFLICKMMNHDNDVVSCLIFQKINNFLFIASWIIHFWVEISVTSFSMTWPIKLDFLFSKKLMSITHTFSSHRLSGY